MTYLNSVIVCGLEPLSEVVTQLITVLLTSHHYAHFHQLAQYFVVDDTEHLCCTLLALGRQYPPASQLALDMFKRLGKGERILDTLLEKGLVLQAFQYFKQNVIGFAPQRFLETALEQKCDTLFMAILSFWASESKKPTSVLKQKDLQSESCQTVIKKFLAEYPKYQNDISNMKILQ